MGLKPAPGHDESRWDVVASGPKGRRNVAWGWRFLPAPGRCRARDLRAPEGRRQTESRRAAGAGRTDWWPSRTTSSDLATYPWVERSTPVSVIYVGHDQPPSINARALCRRTTPRLSGTHRRVCWSACWAFFRFVSADLIHICVQQLGSPILTDLLGGPSNSFYQRRR